MSTSVFVAFLLSYSLTLRQLRSYSLTWGSCSYSVTSNNRKRLLKIAQCEPGFTHSVSSFDSIFPTVFDKIIRLSNSSTSLLDPAATSLLKNCLTALSLPITHFINTSKSSGTVPSKLKIAAITPVLKKHGLDSSSLSSYRPFSNISFLSKILEKVVAFQLQAYLTAHNLYQPFQSGFHPLHST